MSQHSFSGGCHCGNIHLTIELSRPPDTYNPRACDCDFCRKHGAAYVSDPQGSLRVRIENSRQTLKYRQGSGQVDCLICSRCGVLVGAFYRSGERNFGVVNARALDAAVTFGSERTVSPKALSDTDKAQRWQEIWFADVSMEQDAVKSD
jgi:hypothetical protein